MRGDQICGRTGLEESDVAIVIEAVVICVNR